MTYPWQRGRTYRRWDSSLNVVFDGNSLVSGVGASSGHTLPDQVMGLAPVTGIGASYSNLGISGQTWAMMIASDADVDAAWATGKTNVLVCWESTNAIFVDGDSAIVTASYAAGYVQNRRIAKNWDAVVMLTTIPRSGSTAQCQALVDSDDILRRNWRSYGIDALVDVRAGSSPFNFLGDNSANFTAQQGLWNETSGWTHLTDSGYAIIAAMVADTLKRIPYRNASVTVGGALAPSQVATGSGGLVLTGSGAGVLPGLVGATPVTAITGTGAPSEPGLVAAGAGGLALSGSGAPAEPSLTAAGIGTESIPGSGSASLPGQAPAGAGGLAISGSGAGSLPGQGGASTPTIGGTGTPVLPGQVASGSGTTPTTVSGAGAPSLPGLHAVGTDAAPISGTGTATLPDQRARGADSAPPRRRTQAATLLMMVAAGGRPNT